VRRYEVLVHVPPTSPPRAEAQASSSGLSGWGLLGLAAGAVAVGAAAAVVSSLNSDDESDSDSSSDSDNAVDPTEGPMTKEKADLAEALRQSLLLHCQPRPPSPSPAASTPSQGSASSSASPAAGGASASAASRAASSSGSLPAPECIVCWNSLNPPKRIHHCVNGHFVCDDCRPQLQKCSLCRAVFAGRATGMEQFLRELHKKP